MAKFIKLTNSQPYSIDGRPLEVVDETILSTDRICSLVRNGNEYRIVTHADIINRERMTVQHTTSHTIISKEDYENAKSLLLGNDQSITPTDGNDAGPAIEIYETDDPKSVEKEMIQRLMKEYKNNKVGVAMRMGISMRSLNRKLVEYGL